MNSLSQLLTEECQREGFPWSGGVNLEDAEGIHSHFEFFEDWLSRGHHGEMSYLERGKERRSSVTFVYAKTQSVFCVAFPYPAIPHGATEATRGTQYAKYLRGGDYHHWIKERLESALQRTHSKYESETGIKIEWKVCVDTSAVLERSWAFFSGLGWIGKNSMMIHPKHGSYFLVGVVLLSEKLETSSKTLPNYCGSCTRCIDACPTDALVSPGVLDSNRCLSYWTIEKRGAVSLAEPDRKAIGNWIVGCDICQDVCPFNSKVIKNSNELRISAEFTSQPSDWIYLLGETEQEYLVRIKDSALNRVKWENFQRNLAWVFRNTLEANPIWSSEILREISELVRVKMKSFQSAWLKEEWAPIQTYLEALR